MSGLICLYFGAGECPNCGGSTKADGGPFVDVKGVTYCSEECAEQAAEYASQMDERHRRWFVCCPECGFDRQEHDGGCTQVPV
jgi:hypothetical protein